MYILPPAGGRIRSQGNKMRHLRRRNHECAEGWEDWWARERARGEYRFMKLKK
jgi:hypothetical protein